MRKLIKSIVFLSLLILVSCSNDEQQDLKNIISKGTAEYNNELSIDTNYAYLVNLTDSKGEKYKFHFFSNIPISKKEFTEKGFITKSEYGSKSIKETKGCLVVFHLPNKELELSMYYNYKQTNGYYIAKKEQFATDGTLKWSGSNGIEKIDYNFMDLASISLKCNFEGVVIKYNIKLN